VNKEAHEGYYCHFKKVKSGSGNEMWLWSDAKDDYHLGVGHVSCQVICKPPIYLFICGPWNPHTKNIKKKKKQKRKEKKMNIYSENKMMDLFVKQQ
jgi:hypothetical protein